MKITVVGAGAMGGSFGGLLALAGHEVRLIDIDEAHVSAINREGLLVDGALGTHRIKVPAATEPEDGEVADVAIMFCDTNNTKTASKTVAKLIGNHGFAITFQNGIGNVEALTTEAGRARTLGGSSMCSAANLGPGHVSLTHMGKTSVGELDGASSTRAKALADALAGAGFAAEVSDKITGQIWQKFLVKCAVNAIAATTGLRSGEIPRVPELAEFQAQVINEVLKVIEIKGIKLPNPNVVDDLKQHLPNRFNRPSMLQHVDAGRPTEIDAINGALNREAKDLGIAIPYNESLIALLKGREQAQIRSVHDPDFDYEAWEARIAAGEEK